MLSFSIILIRTEDESEQEEIMTSWSSKEKSNEQLEQTQQLQQQLYNEMHPRRKPLHVFFILISVVAALSALNMMIGQIIGLTFGTLGPIQYVLRVYVVLLCVLVILNEMECTKLTRDSFILYWWVTRGPFYAFVGVLGLVENDVNGNENVKGRDAAIGYIVAVAWIMIGVGCLYFVMGVLCGQFLLNRTRDDYKQRCERAKETRRTAETYMADSISNPV